MHAGSGEPDDGLGDSPSSCRIVTSGIEGEWSMALIGDQQGEGGDSRGGLDSDESTGISKVEGSLRDLFFFLAREGVDDLLGE